MAENNYITLVVDSWIYLFKINQSQTAPLIIYIQIHFK
jgi:hypothetical protein